MPRHTILLPRLNALQALLSLPLIFCLLRRALNGGLLALSVVKVAAGALCARAARHEPEMGAEMIVALSGNLFATNIAHDVAAHARQLVTAG